LKGGHVGWLACPNDKIGGLNVRKKVEPNKLTQSALELITSDSSLLSLGNYDPSSRMCQRGSHCPDVKKPRPSALPLSYDSR
jgi:hypothetical protein